MLAFFYVFWRNWDEIEYGMEPYKVIHPWMPHETNKSPLFFGLTTQLAGTSQCDL